MSEAARRITTGTEIQYLNQYVAGVSSVESTGKSPGVIFGRMP